jgi:2,4-dienoyl-CoA reductase-like NADH-dependent reductase (Old Yellow Enzyme family)
MTETLLFSPMTIRGATLKNRIVVPPMHQYSAVKGFPTDWHLMNAGKFAAGGAGLVVVESTKVERRGCGTVGDLGIWDDAFVEPLGRLVHQAAEFSRGIFFRPFRPQGPGDAALGGRPPAAADA